KSRMASTRPGCLEMLDSALPYERATSMPATSPLILASDEQPATLTNTATPNSMKLVRADRRTTSRRRHCMEFVGYGARQPGATMGRDVLGPGRRNEARVPVLSSPEAPPFSLWYWVTVRRSLFPFRNERQS